MQRGFEYASKTWHPVKREMLPFQCKCNCARRRRAHFILNKVQTTAIYVWIISCKKHTFFRHPSLELWLSSWIKTYVNWITFDKIDRWHGIWHKNPVSGYFRFINIPDVKVLVWKFWLKVLGGSRKLGLNSGSGALIYGAWNRAQFIFIRPQTRNHDQGKALSLDNFDHKITETRNKGNLLLILGESQSSLFQVLMKYEFLTYPQV